MRLFTDRKTRDFWVDVRLMLGQYLRRGPELKQHWLNVRVSWAIADVVIMVIRKRYLPHHRVEDISIYSQY